MNNNKNFKDSKYNIGSWVQIGDPNFTKMMVRSGFSFMVMDMEHGSIAENSLSILFDACKGHNCKPFVRIAENKVINIRRALDLGAKGIIVPNVNSLDDVLKAENAIYYPPEGQRGIGYSKSCDYGLGFNEYFSSINKDITFVVQIENHKALSNIDEIFSSNSIDYYIIGPYDLTGSMGIIGEFDNPIYLEHLNKIKKSAEKNGIKSGIHVINPNVNDLKNAINEGYNFIAYSTDALLMYEKCNNDLKTISNKK